MGRYFFECLGGKTIFSCIKCDTFLTNLENLNSDKFKGSTGQAYLFNDVTNIDLTAVEEKHMMTGKHMVRDAYCKNCKSRVGWMYEFAFSDDQRYKEGKIILEVNLIKRSRGVDSIVMPIPSAFHQLLSTTPSPTESNNSVTLAAQFSRNSSTSSFSSSTNSSSNASTNDEENMRRINGIRIGPRIRLHPFRR